MSLFHKEKVHPLIGAWLILAVVIICVLMLLRQQHQINELRRAYGPTIKYHNKYWDNYKPEKVAPVVPTTETQKPATTTKK